VPQCVVPDAHRAYGQLCQALAGFPSRRLKVIGVTGTNGKTTTTQLIRGILDVAGYGVGSAGTLGYCDSLEPQPALLTTPAAPTLADWLRRTLANGCTHAVMEVSSHALAQRRIAGIEFDAVCVTNVRQDHLDYHGSLENYREAKARIFEQLSPRGVAVLNGDDPVCQQYATRVAQPTCVVGLLGQGPLSATLVERSLSEQTFLLSAGSDTVPVRTQMIGDHHLANCLIAATVGMLQGIDLPTIAAGLESIGHLSGRLERIECGQPFGVFVDFAHTPDALAASLDVLRRVTAGRLICVFGAGGDRDASKRPLMGRAVEQRADMAIITTDNPRHESPAAIARDIQAGLQRRGSARVMLDRERAIKHALAQAQADDCVLIAGKGHEQFQIIGESRYEFDDAYVARCCLYNREPNTSNYGRAQLALGNC
jgi:UDP-N-acetylmuramoyl-L-alanyl-D-glutamate--2,6-diaminopimelate ligase